MTAKNINKWYNIHDLRFEYKNIHFVYRCIIYVPEKDYEYIFTSNIISTTAFRSCHGCPFGHIVCPRFYICQSVRLTKQQQPRPKHCQLTASSNDYVNMYMKCIRRSRFYSLCCRYIAPFGVSPSKLCGVRCVGVVCLFRVLWLVVASKGRSAGFAMLRSRLLLMRYTYTHRYIQHTFTHT